MIDLHCHILPGLDDGAPDLGVALAMVLAAAEDGITDIVTTPHFLVEDRYARVEFAPALAELRSGIKSLDLPVRLHGGAEVMLDPELPDLARDHSLPTLANGPYVLIELPFHSLPNYAEDVLFALQTEGLRPIIAHPERCGPLRRDSSPLERLVERGMLVQINAGSLLGLHGPDPERTARTLLRAGLAHIIASDGHSLVERPPLLADAVVCATALVGQATAGAMVTTTPAAVLAGAPVTPGPFASPSSIKRSGRRWLFPFGR